MDKCLSCPYAKWYSKVTGEQVFKGQTLNRFPPEIELDCDPPMGECPMEGEGNG